MRLTISEDKDQMVIKIEGRLVRPWTSELESTWGAINLGSKKLSLDISEMLFIDDIGKQILKNIVNTTSCEIRANSPLTKYFAGEIARTTMKPDREN